MPLGFHRDPTTKPEFGAILEPDNSLVTGLIAYWPLLEGVGTTAGDVAGYAVGTLTNFGFTGTSGWVGGPAGNALIFDGTNDRIATSISDSFLTGNAPYTMAVRARWTDSGSRVLFGAGTASTTVSRGFVEILQAAGTVRASRNNTSANQTAAIALNDGAWHTMAASYDGANLWLYADGVLVGTVASAFSYSGDGSPVYLGARTGGAFPFAGTADWFGLWGRALTSEEIARLHWAPYGMFQPAVARRFFALAGSSSFSFSPSGGIILGGTSSPGVTFSPAPSGGLVSGGTTTPGVTFSPPPSGGAVLGGVSFPSFSADVSPSGGVVLGGSAPGTLSGSGLIVRPHLDPTIKPPLGWPADPEAAINRDLVGWWIANEGQGRVWADLVSGISAIFPATPTWAADLRGPTVSISGPSSNQIAAASNASGIYDLTGPLTVSAWITVAASGAGGHGFVSKGTGALLQGYALRWNGSNNPVFTTGGGAAASSLTGATVLAVGVTYHLVGVYDGAGGRLYVNGKLDASGAMANAPTASGTDLKFGSFGDGSAIHTGFIGDVRLYRRALTADEVGTLYSAPDAGLMPPTIRLISSGAPSFSYSPSGGAVLGGSSPPSFSVTVSPSGGVILGGTAQGSSSGGSFSFSPFGGLVAGGSSTPGVTFSPAPSGGLKAGGTATPTATFSIAASGGLLAGGTASPGVTFSPPPSGGAVLGGTAPGTLIGANSFSYTPSGGVLVGGSAFVFMAVASLPCDRVAYDAIKSLLEGLGEFDEVTIGRELAFKPTQASLGKFCHIQPLGTPTLVQDDSPWVLMNVAKFRLVVAVREPNDEDTLRAIDRLKGAIMFSLLKAENRAYGGFCRPWLSKLRPVSIPGRKDIGLPMEFQGEFSYMVSTQIGYDSTSD